jgi:4-alpha-glucanotransferase
MEVHFLINYCTIWGEDIRVKILHSDGEEQIFQLSTSDGKIWTGKLSVSGDIVYSYCVYQSGVISRAEWNINKRYVTDDGTDRTIFLNDAWRSKDDFSCFYSSAFTESVRRCSKDTSKNTKAVSYDKAIELRVSAPQLLGDEVLCISGNQKMLGNWDVDKPVCLQRTDNLLEWSIVFDASKLSFPIEFKFYAYNKESDKITDWENRNNRILDYIEIDKQSLYVMSDINVYFSRPRWKGAGVAIPVFSLRTEKSYGVGDFGDLKKMVDWVSLTHQRVLQLLPLNDTTITHTWTDSYPYSSISIYALHPIYINLPALGRLKDAKQMAEFAKEQKVLNNLPQLDYEKVSALKWKYVRLMFAQEGQKVLQSKGFSDFYASNEYWLMPYAAFCYLRDKYSTADFRQWKTYKIFDRKKVAKLCDPSSKIYNEIAIYYYVQYNLHLQLLDAGDYARRHQVVLKGDIPIGISRNSVEAWTEPFYFNMNGQAGAPPDDFSVKGQNWGFPTYNWDEMAKDGYKWWKYRFCRLAQYLDAYRIDHILGFFRIWEIPLDSVHGLLGQFSPSLPLSVDEIQSYGLAFRKELFTRPYINDYVLNRIFDEHAEKVKSTYLQASSNGMYDLLPQYDTQRKIEAVFAGKDDEESTWIREGLYALVSDVLFVHDRKNPELYHPRIAVQYDFIFESLGWKEKEAFNRLYNDYYYRRHNDFWYHEAMKKLPQLIGSTRMLVCGEDLGMVPDCVGSVMNELHILSLELQRMPKQPKQEFGHVNEYPYYSVCTFSSHDTSTIRGWWKEDMGKTSSFFREELHQQGDIPAEAPGWACEMIVNQQLQSTSMLCILSFQDWLSINEAVRNPDADAERINVPANPHHYWRYRMHLTIEKLMKCKELNDKIISMIDNSGRMRE